MKLPRGFGGRKPSPSTLPERAANFGELKAVETVARQIWRVARDSMCAIPDIFPGYESSFDHERQRAQVLKRLGPVHGSVFAVYLGEMDIWHAEWTQYWPGTELEPSCRVNGFTATYPLVERGQVMWEQYCGGLRGGIPQLDELRGLEFKGPVSASRVSFLLDTMRHILPTKDTVA